MSSELSESICTTYLNNSEGALLRDVIDAELQEVREALDDLCGRPVGGCWCSGAHYDKQSPDLPYQHSESCKRVAALCQRLHVDGGKGE